MRKIYMLYLLLFAVATSFGANHYVRQGASGNGSDWTNAYGQLPATLVRGDTYYIADGNYGSYTFDDPVSGTQVITIKKATPDDHGTDTGWDDSYGDNPAEFIQVSVNTGYFDLDGATGGGPGSWKTGHGIVFSQNAGTNRTFISIADAVSNVTIRRCKFYEIGDTEQGRYGATGIGNSPALYNLLVERCYFENLNGLPFFFRGGSGVILQYNYTGDVCGCSVWSSDWHCEVLVCHSLSDVHFRWNYLSECPSSGGFVKNNSNTSSDVRIYGNIFRDGYAVNCNTGTCPRWRIFNNTVATDGGAFGGDGGRVDWYVYNNILFSQNASRMPAENGYNLFSEPTGNSCSMNAGPGENVITRYPNNCDLIDDVPDPFVNSAGTMPEDFRLDGPITDWGGYDVCQLDACTGSKQYDRDMFGNARGGDGVWDRGAIEYSPTNIEYRTPNAERRIITHQNPINNLRLTISNRRIYNVKGERVLSIKKNQTGIYLVPSGGKFFKVVILK